MASSMAEEIRQMVLSPSSSKAAKISALNFFLGLTATEDGLKHIAASEDYLCIICTLMNDSITQVSEYGFKCLVNLSACEEMAGKLISLTSPDFLQDLLNYIKNVNNKNVDLACKIFSNITTFSRHCEVVLKCLTKSHSLEDLINIFCTKVESYHYLAPVFCNITQVIEGRRLFMDKETRLIKCLLPFTTYMNSDVRRSGVVGAIRNCCFETDYHDWLLSDTVNILTPLLLPLAGPEEFDDDEIEKLPLELQYLGEEKQREPIPALRQMLIEAIFQLCATKNGREFVKENHSYLIMRELHKVETSKTVLHACENLVDILIGEEPEPGMENLKEVAIPQHYMEQFEKLDEQLKKEF